MTQVQTANQNSSSYSIKLLIFVFTGTFRSIWLYILCIDVLFSPIHFMSNKLFLVLKSLVCFCSHWWTLIRTFVRRLRRTEMVTKSRRFPSGLRFLLVLSRARFLFFCKYGSLCMFTFLWASTFSFLSPKWMIISVDLVFTECKHWQGLMNFECVHFST